MKKIALILCTLTLLACGSKKINDSDVVFYKCELGQFSLQKRLGCDKESALDSLLKIKSDLPDTPFVATAEQLDVGWCVAAHCSNAEPNKCCLKPYSNDERQFFIVVFKRDMEILNAPQDIIDNQGNWYTIFVKARHF